jgi:hypothetical protein
MVQCNLVTCNPWTEYITSLPSCVACSEH